MGACLWWLVARGWVGIVQMGKPFETTKRRQKWAFWEMLAAAYLMMFGSILYDLLRSSLK